MPSKDFGEDVAFILYLVPVVISIIYGAVEWATTAASSTMPQSSYLIVSKSPYLFLISLVAICVGIILELRSADTTERNGLIEANTRRLQILAVVVLVVSFLAAFSAGSYNLATAFSLFVNGRYALIFAFFLIGLSLLLSPKEVLGNLRVASIPDILGMLLLVGAPVLFYAGLRIHLSFTISAIGALIVGIIGFLLLFNESSFIGKKQTKPKEVKQPASSDVMAPRQAPESQSS